MKLFRRKHEKEVAQLRLAYVRLFDTADGRVVLKHLCQMFHIGYSTYDCKYDSHLMAFNEGERAAILHILYMTGDRSDPVRLNALIDESETDQ